MWTYVLILLVNYIEFLDPVATVNECIVNFQRFLRQLCQLYIATSSVWDSVTPGIDIILLFHVIPTDA